MYLNSTIHCNRSNLLFSNTHTHTHHGNRSQRPRPDGYPVQCCRRLCECHWLHYFLSLTRWTLLFLQKCLHQHFFCWKENKRNQACFQLKPFKKKIFIFFYPLQITHYFIYCSPFSGKCLQKCWSSSGLRELSTEAKSVDLPLKCLSQVVKGFVLSWLVICFGTTVGTKT